MWHRTLEGVVATLQPGLTGGSACETTLDFLVDNDSDILVDRFDTVFLNRLATFTNAVHVFDEEPQIQASMKRRRMVSGDQPITYCFANSRSEPAIRVSDVLCGILGKHFSCMEKLSIEQLEAWNTHLSDQQRRSVVLLAKLIDKADEECQRMFLQGRLVADTNDRWRETQPCSVDAQNLASGNDCLRRQQTFGTEVRKGSIGDYHQRRFVAT